MTLPSSYLEYPHRSEGYDHGLYSWSNIHRRPPFRWPDGRALMVWPCIVAEFFPLTPADKPFRAPGHMQTAFPDWRHFTARDYGSRVGMSRLLDALEARGLRASVAMNVALAERAPALLQAVRQGGHEIIAHGRTMNDAIDSSVPREVEQAMLADTLARWRALGEDPKGWLSIARSQSWATLDLLRDAGLGWCADWPNDDLPYRMANGLINLPLNHELSDRQIVGVCQASAEEWAEQLLDAARWLSEEAGSERARLLPIQLTPYIIGLPYRIAAVEKLLDALIAMGAGFAPGGEIVEAWVDAQG